MNTKDFDLTMTRHACSIAAKNGWKPEQIMHAFHFPVSVTPNPEREGQFIITGDGIVFVGVQMDDSTFRAITVKKEK